MDSYRKFFAEHIGIKLTSKIMEDFSRFEEILLDWNHRINLTRITDSIGIQVKHFVDSLMSFIVLPIQGEFSLIDVGTGGGFPGIPLLIVNPSIELTLADSVRKKIEFCRTAVDTLGFSDVNTIHARAEDLGRDNTHRERYDWAVARAVAPLNQLCEYLLPLVHVGGGIIALKGSSIEEEINQAEKAITTLGGKVSGIHAVELPEKMGTRSLIHIAKIKPTPAKYPRKAGTPRKSPLV